MVQNVKWIVQVSQKIDKLRPPDGQIPSCWKTLVYLKLICFLWTLIAYHPPNVGNRKCLFIYKYMGEQLPFILFKKILLQIMLPIHSSFAHKIHSSYFDSQYELCLNNKHLSYNGQPGGLAIWQSFFQGGKSKL